MPIHLDEVDITSAVDGLNSALIVSCNMCAGASFAMKENKPFLQIFRTLFKSPPLERRIQKLQYQLSEKGMKTKWFRVGILQQFFLCLWTLRQRSKLRKSAEQYEAVIVLGCESAFKTIRDTVKGTGCKVIERTKVAGIMNTKPRISFPLNISFEDSTTTRVCDRRCERFTRKS